MSGPSRQLAGRAQDIWPAGGQEMGVRFQNHGWAATPLGSLDAWPQSLRTAVELMLAQPYAASLCIGPSRILVYNDAYARAIGSYHPAAFGCDVRTALAAESGRLGALLDRVFAGETVCLPDQPVPLPTPEERSGAWFDVSHSPVRDEAGRVIAAFALAVETTERVLAKRRQARAETALQAAYDKAERARRTAEEANRAKSRFLAAASHDLRQPLQSLLLFLDVVRPHVGAGGREPFRHLGLGVDVLREVLDGLLDVARLDAGMVLPAVKRFGIGDLLRRIHAAYAPPAEAKGLAFSPPACGMAVSSDPILLERILRNLVENAVRYTEHGRIGLECRVVGTGLCIEVADTGIGIAAEHLGRIWEEFHQVENSERDRSRGLGLGLAIVRRLSGLLDHPVAVRSVPGCGSVFSVTVPLAP